MLIETKLLYKIVAALKEIMPGYYTFAGADEVLDDDVVTEQERVKNVNNADVLKVFGLQKKFRRFL